MPDRTEPPEPSAPAPPHGQVLIYQDGATRLQVRLEGRTVWLSQWLIAEVFQVTVPTVNEHLAGIYADGELDQTATIRSFRIVQTEGRRQVARAIDHYNLDAILAVGYRVRCARIANTYHAWRGEKEAGKYADVTGLCKSAPLDEVRKHGHVLTPGRYVGALRQEDDGEPFEEKMKRLTATLRKQQAEAAKLDAAIAANLKELGYGG